MTRQQTTMVVRNCLFSSRSLLLTLALASLLTLATAWNAHPFQQINGFAVQGYWDPSLVSCFGKPTGVDESGKPLFDGCLSQSSIASMSMASSCDMQGGLSYRVYIGSDNCTGLEFQRWQSIDTCFTTETGPTALQCPGSKNDFSKVKQITQPPISGAGNVSTSEFCGGSTGVKCRGPRVLTWNENMKCSGQPDSQSVIYKGMMPDTCHRLVSAERPDWIGANIRATCDGLSSRMRISFYNSGCSGMPYRYDDVPIGTCFSFGPGWGSLMYLC